MIVPGVSIRYVRDRSVPEVGGYVWSTRRLTTADPRPSLDARQYSRYDLSLRVELAKLIKKYLGV
jgi:hypothetical protein